MASTLNHRKALLVLNGLKHVGPIMLRRLLDTFDHDPVAVLAADRQSSPMLNRVVAGTCEAIILVESAVAGGSMITARFAGEQGRQIMAVTGRIDQTSSGGCHQLIRDGTTMATSVDDILEAH